MSQVISRDGTTIVYDRLGAGPPLVVVDGAFCGRTFGPSPKLAPVLARRFTVFTYDRRGRGDSGDTAPYAVQREIEDLGALIAEADGRAFVYGISSGAILALHAATAGLGIDRLALYEPPFFVGPHARRPPADAVAQLVQLVAAGRRGDAVGYYMRRLVGVPGFLVAFLHVTPMWSKLKAAAASLSYDAAVLGDFAVPTQAAGAITIPALVASGGKTHPMLRDAADALAAALRSAERRTLEGQTHDVKPAALAPLLEEFFLGGKH